MLGTTPLPKRASCLQEALYFCANSLSEFPIDRALCQGRDSDKSLTRVLALPFAAHPALSSGCRLRGEFDSERIHHGERCLQRWISSGAERAIELLAGQAGLGGNLRHSFGARYDSERMRDVGDVVGPEGLCHEDGDGFVGSEIFCGIIV